MNKLIIIILCILIILITNVFTFNLNKVTALSTTAEEINNTPIIGILSQEISYHLNTKYPEQYKSFIAASYVKFVEGGGARVVPICVLFPGGATWFNQTDGYADAGRYIYDIASDMNDKGIYMPIWGTCLGFELLTYLSADGNEHRAHCYSDRQPLALEFVDDFKNSRLFGSTPNNIIDILSSEEVTPNFHQYCVTQQNLTDYDLDKYWQVLSLNNDWNNLTFISSIEHKKYPYYGVQFHPEKNIYEWIANRNILHTSNAIEAAQYFAKFFVNETRRNLNKFQSIDEENDYLIYNFEKTFTGLVKSAYEECYLFDENIDYGQRSSAIKMDFSKFLMLLCIFFVQSFIFKIFL